MKKKTKKIANEEAEMENKGNEEEASTTKKKKIDLMKRRAMLAMARKK